MAKPVITLAAALSALFPKSEKVISEKISQDEFNAFGAEVQEIQNRLDAQADGNQAVADDLTNTKATLTDTEAKLTEAQTKLTASESAVTTANQNLKTAQDLNTELKAKADQWDGYKASLKNSNAGGDSTNPKSKTESDSQLTEKDQKHLASVATLSAKYPNLMAGIGVPAKQE